MGMFDSIYVDCPSCGEKETIELQSKSGPCTLERYTLENAPSEVLSGVHTDIDFDCRSCWKRFKVQVRATERKIEVVVGYVLTIIPVKDEEE